MKNIDNLCAFIFSTLNRDEQLYLAAQIHLNVYSIRDTALPLVKLEENKAPAVVDQNLGNKIAEIKNIDKNWIIDHYFQELYFYESAIKKREQEKIWNANYIAKRKQDSVIREKRIRFTDSLRLVRTQKYQPKNAPKKVVTQK